VCGDAGEVRFGGGGADIPLASDAVKEEEGRDVGDGGHSPDPSSVSSGLGGVKELADEDRVNLGVMRGGTESRGGSKEDSAVDLDGRVSKRRRPGRRRKTHLVISGESEKSTSAEKREKVNSGASREEGESGTYAASKRFLRATPLKTGGGNKGSGSSLPASL
jgi:hypothetical protein